MVRISTLSNQLWMSARSHSAKSPLVQVQPSNENIPPPQLTETHSLSSLFTSPPSRSRKGSTSSVATIKCYGEISTEKKKRPRESTDGGRRTRQRTASTASTDTVIDGPGPSCVPFPSSPPAPENVTKSQHSTRSSSPRRHLSAPKPLLIPTRAAPSVPIVTKVASVHNPKPPMNEAARFEPFPELLSSSPQNRSWLDHLDSSSISDADYDLSISFYKRQPHFDVWDLDDDVCIGIPARIHMLDEPDVRFLDITCQSYEHPFPHPYHLQAEPEYTVSFRGYHRTWTNGPETELNLTKGIVVCPRWFNDITCRSVERIVTSRRGVLPPDSDCSPAPQVDGNQDVKRRYIKILIPIPMKLIRKGNARVFRVEVKAGRVPVEGYGLEEVGGAEAEVVVSHLGSEFEMGMRGKAV
ncbi:hypothetical protein E1B28_006923 [Marasmius oreades]|uniref:Uncharacterized protein n=1 Tax=Marasmius oreades TaxID=181124 RepID=A0A9P7S0S1_9AGAR|nr:uncharacterized protein E1B28_006923 [Marasmius oreades]KAG7093237.1 hypothetical protein E1B28_006923 [Marasmius oreades]